MRKLILSLVLIPCLAWGQKKDSIIAKIIGSGTEVFPKSQAELFYESKSKQDTIKALMLVCDTTNKKDSAWVSEWYSPLVYWKFGYEVIEGWRMYRYFQDGSKTPMFKVIDYLDENKKPLPKNIIIWQTKEIK